MASQTPRARHQGLQAMRGIAATMVFVHHLPWFTKVITGEGNEFIPMLGLGDAGVFLFFVLSGYLMTYKVSASPLRFIIARLRRIMPGLWLALLLCASILWLTGGPFTWHWQPYILYPAGTGNHGWGVPYWTLHFEMAFYLLVFFAILVAKRPVVFIAVALALSYSLSDRPYVWRDVAYPDWPHLFLNAFALLFLTGAIIGQVKYRLQPRAALVVALIGATIFWIPEIRTVTGWKFYYPAVFWNAGALPLFLRAIGAGLVIFAALSWEPRTLASRLLAHIGDASYGIYLVHIGIGLGLAHWLKQTTVADWPYYASMLAVAIPAYILAYAFGMFEFKLQDWFKSYLPVGIPLSFGVTPTSAPASSTMISKISTG